MTNLMDTPAVYRIIFRAALKRVRAADAKYRAEVDDWFENGDGAPADWQRAGDQPWFDPETDNPDRMVNLGGRGYRFPYCLHGMNLWVDYDPICGYCEEGLTALQEAQGHARAQFRELVRRWDFVSAMPDNLPNDIHQPIVAWAMSAAEWS